MIRYRPEQLEKHLREIDHELTDSVDVIIIGGAAVGLGYGSTHATRDIDLWKNPAQLFWDAVRRVEARTGVAVPMSPAVVAEPPEGFEERLQRHRIADTSRLRIWLPERHDLALMKVARGETADLDAIEDIHHHEPLEFETLLARYSEVMPMGPPSRFRVSFLAMIARLFGDDRADEAAARLGP